LSGIRELQAEWYKKLKESGFEDIEYRDGQLKAETKRGKQFIEMRESSYDFYDIASSFLEKGEFDHELDRKIWELFCDGISIRNSAKTLHTYKFKVHTTINKYKVKFGIS
jgi:hypothetical protein